MAKEKDLSLLLGSFAEQAKDCENYSQENIDHLVKTLLNRDMNEMDASMVRVFEVLSKAIKNPNLSGDLVGQIGFKFKNYDSSSLLTALIVLNHPNVLKDDYLQLVNWLVNSGEWANLTDVQVDKFKLKPKPEWSRELLEYITLQIPNMSHFSINKSYAFQDKGLDWLIIHFFNFFGNIEGITGPEVVTSWKIWISARSYTSLKKMTEKVYLTRVTSKTSGPFWEIKSHALKKMKSSIKFI